MPRTLFLLFLCTLLPASGLDIDSGKDAIGLEKTIASLEQGATGSELKAEHSKLFPDGWMRLRGVAEPHQKPPAVAKAMAGSSGGIATGEEDKVQATREALRRLRERGLKTCVLLRWPADWRKVYLPMDLGLAFENGRTLGSAYCDLVDAWEVDNEPDLGFVPEAGERYAAYLKATYLGLKRGMAECQASGLSVKSSELGGRDTPNKEPLTSNASGPLILMGSLGLPPGPWLERFAANDGFSYTDGFNYHYYGYAEDFSAVYHAHENALKQLGVMSYELGGSITHNQERLTPNIRQEKSLPVFLTEIGYGMLGKGARDTKDGRLLQWRWFKSVGEQAATLRIEAPMAFYLPPYLEYDTLEFGLTVPAKQGAELGVKGYELGGKPVVKWTAGGITYTASDFGEQASEPWMEEIGKDIGGNQITPALAQWMALRHDGFEVGRVVPNAPKDSESGGLGTIRPISRSRSWSVTVAQPSPVVIDFLPGEGLASIKRYNGSFVTGLTEDKGQRTEDGGKPKAADTKITKPDNKQPAASNQPTKSEEFMIHVRTQNGNLYEVYPTRLATPDWQTYSESQENFTLSFYGRAELPWRFKDNKPASLVVVMYPKQLPATFEFRRVQLLKLSAPSSQLSANFRYARGTVVLYNFSDKPVTGRLILPHEVSAASASSVLKLQPGERRETPVSIKVPWERFERIDAPIAFVPEDQAIPAARFLTTFIPDIGGMRAAVVAELLPQLGSAVAEPMGDKARSLEPGANPHNQEPLTNNRSLIATRVRATEEAPMTEQILTNFQVSAFRSQVSVFSQHGATVERTAGGFTVTVTGTPPGKPQRVEIEIPWPDGLPFKEDEFLNLEYRLKP